MTLIRVNPDSVRDYGRQAQHVVERVHDALVSLVDDVATVRYFGPNAVGFKRECGRMAADFANGLHADLAAMADAVRMSTSNIAGALGGEPISISVDPRPIHPPVPEVVSFVDVDTSALESLVPAISRRFVELRELLAANLRGLHSTDWEGNAKLAAVDAVQGFTTAAQRQCESAEHSLTLFVNEQLSSVLAADR